MKILFAGDANIDFQMTGLSSFPQVDREVLCSGFAAAIGGSTTICAAAYATLGGSAFFCGLLGDDENGRLMERMLRGAGVRLDLLRFTREHSTGVTVNLVHHSTRTQITYPGTLTTVDETDAILQAMGSFSHIHLSGVYPLIRFLPRIRAVLLRARDAGVTSSLDTQWDQQETWNHLSDWLPILTYLFVNEEESLSITKKADIDSAYNELASRTACPLIKRGASGVYARGRRFPSFAVEVRDTTGAGDTFAAGFLFAMKEKSMPFDDAVRFGCAAAALCCTFTGGVSAEELRPERVMRLMNEGNPS
ncbi:MAG: carbohydrate kinase family protein [Spirochaetia bacterium]|jgi:sugar/nucleoside kinase (ribokinase family)